MENKDFKKIVSEMREAQQRYFKTRDRRDLAKAKECEKVVDEFLKRYFQEQSAAKKLFD